MPPHETKKQGDWTETNDTMMKVYLHCEPVTFMHRMFGHKYDQMNIQSEIFLERGILNYNSLEYQKVSKLIFQVALNEQKDKLDKEDKGISKANFDAVDLALENVIELFKILRNYFPLVEAARCFHSNKEKFYNNNFDPTLLQYKKFLDPTILSSIQHTLFKKSVVQISDVKILLYTLHHVVTIHKKVLSDVKTFGSKCQKMIVLYLKKKRE